MLFHPKENDIIIKGNYLIHSCPIKLILTTFQAHVLTYVWPYDQPTDDWVTQHWLLYTFFIRFHTKMKRNYWKSLNFPFCAANKYNKNKRSLYFGIQALSSVTFFQFCTLVQILLWNIFLCCSTSSRNLFFGTLTLTLFSVPCRSCFFSLTFSSN